MFLQLFFLAGWLIMSNQVLDPSFELGLADPAGYTGWSHNLGTERTDAYGARTGDWAAKVPTIGFQSGFMGQVVSVVPGHTYGAGIFVKKLSGQAGIVVLVIGQTTGTEYVVDQLGSAEDTGDWQALGGTFIPVTDTEVSFVIQSFSEGFGDGAWLADDALAGEAMAIKLAERPIDAFVTSLQANLPTELAAIDAERGDGVTLAVPPNANYYKRPKAYVAGDGAHIEVFESAFSFDDPRYLDAAGTKRLTESIPLTVRVTWFNRNQDSADTVFKRMRRYASGVVTVLMKNRRFAGTDSSILLARVGRFDPLYEADPDNPEFITKGTVSIQALIEQEETA